MSTALTLPAARRIRPGLLAVLAGVLIVHGWLLGWGRWRDDAQPAPGPRGPAALHVRSIHAAPLTESRPALHKRDDPAPVRRAVPSDTSPTLAPAPTPSDEAAPALPTASEPTSAAESPAGSAASSPVPLYRTRLPPSGEWRYAFRRAGREGEAQLRWQHDGQRYEARLDGGASGDTGATLQWHSSGEIDGAGLAPSRFVDRRDRRRAAANFDRDHGRIAYSGTEAEQPLWPGGQDRLSVLLQLAAILEGRRSPAAMGEEVRVQVSGARGDAQLWRFEVQGPERVQLPDGTQRFALKLQREPSHAWDTRVEVWTDPSAHHLPLRVVMRNGAQVVELVLKGAADNDERFR